MSLNGKNILLHLSASVPELVSALVDENDTDMLFNVIKAIDEEVSEWGFTERVANWYMEQMKIKEAIKENC